MDRLITLLIAVGHGVITGVNVDTGNYGMAAGLLSFAIIFYLMLIQEEL